MAIAEILAKYDTKAQDEENVGYSPLQCAVYDGEKEDVRVMLEHYKANGTLRAELSRVSPADKTGENILQIAMKHYDILELCCKTAEEVEPTLFTTFAQHVDADEDSVFHQIVEFGRHKSLNILMSYIDKHVDPHELKDVFSKENKHQETAAEIAADYDRSKTVATLKAAGILSTAHVAEARQNLPSIQHVFEEHQLLNQVRGLTSS